MNLREQMRPSPRLVLLLSLQILFSWSCGAPGQERAEAHASGWGQVAAERTDDPARLRLEDLPTLPGRGPDARLRDWLVDPGPWRAGLYRGAHPGELVLTNGLVQRVFRLGRGTNAGQAASVALDDLRTGAGLLRAVRPEARLVVDGLPLQVGGLEGQPNAAYLLPAWLESMQPAPGSLRLVGASSGPPVERLAWKRVRHHAPGAAWPPPGVHLRLDFALDAPALEALADSSAPASWDAARRAALTGLRVSVHYELYDDLPAFTKWLTIRNDSGATLELDRVIVEELAVVERDNRVEAREGVPFQPPDTLHVESDYAMGGMTAANANRFAVRWRADPGFTTQVNYLLQTPCLLEVATERGPDVLLEPGETFESLRAFELLQDSTDRERRGLSRRRMVRTLAPWVTENPLILHVVSSDPAVIRNAVDQAVDCGFEMVSLSFGSGLDMEREDPAYREIFRELAAYAAQRGVQLGGYSLLSSRRIQPDSDNCVNPETGAPGGQTHGFCPALASDWGQRYLARVRGFFEETGFLQFTHDGSYPGDYDAAARPPRQRGLEDSQWVQWRALGELYRWMRSEGVYLRVPDHYFFVGANETGMGYREVNWSLPRAQQVLHTRQNIYDGTWDKTPSMGWMFVPLTQYHGGGAAATIEPLNEHREHYRRMLESNLGYGVQAVYRGQRLYDTPAVRDTVREVVDWYKTYREVLEADLVHGRRADGRDLDWMLHVNPRGEDKGMLIVHNPLDRPRTQELVVPLRYTGLSEHASVSVQGAPAVEMDLDSERRLRLELTVPARSMRWVLLR